MRPEIEGAFSLILLGLLLVSTLDTSTAALLRGAVLVSFGLLTIANAGAAFGVYLGTAALFSVHHFAGQGSWVQRPDNFMFLMLFAYLALGRSFGRTSGALGWTAMAIVALLTTAMLHLVLLVGTSTYELSWFVRSFVMPLLLFVVLRRAGLAPRELRAMFLVLAALGVLHAIVSLAEAARLYDWLVPPWLSDPSFNPAFGIDRMGGIPMQPEWNALDISLMLSVLVLRADLRGTRRGLGAMLGIVLCVLAVYLTYTRAAYLGLIAGAGALFWKARPGDLGTRRRRLLFVAGVGGFVAFVLFFPSDLLRARTGDAGTVYFRLSIWIASLDMMIHNPIWGVGFGQFALHLSPLLREVAWIPPSEMAQEGTLAHNTFLSVGAEFGIVGLALYLGMLVGAYRAAWKAAGEAWGAGGQAWIAAYTAVYLVNIQFITAHKLTSNVLYFGVMGAIAGMQAWRPARAATRPATYPAPAAGRVVAMGERPTA